DFLAVDNEVIAIAHGLRAQRRQIGAGARLGITLHPQIIATQNARQMVGELLLAAPLKQRRAEVRFARLHRARGAGALHLLLINPLLAHTQAHAAVFARPRRATPAVVVQQTHARAQIFAAQTQKWTPIGLPPLIRIIFSEPRAQLLPK